MHAWVVQLVHQALILQVAHPVILMAHLVNAPTSLMVLPASPYSSSKPTIQSYKTQVHRVTICS